MRARIFIFLVLLGGGPLAAQNQDSFQDSLVQQIIGKWGPVPREQLLKAAEAGAVEAQYYYGISETQLALSDLGIATHQWWRSNTPPQQATQSPRAEFEADRAKWAAASEVEARSAATNGDRAAQWVISKLDGDRAIDRGRRAFSWLEKAADQGLAPAEFEISIRYLGISGWRVIDPDPKRGLEWLRRAADHGFEGAQHQLADLFVRGEFMNADIGQAIEFLRKAADQGCPRAQYDLARQYSCGNGEPRSTGETPTALLTRAAKAGWPRAAFALGERSRLGLGTEASKIKAFFWYDLASTGLSTAAVERDKLKPGLTKADDEQLKKLSEEFWRGTH